MASTVYWTDLLIISLESGTRASVSFTFTGEPSANVELRSPAYLMSVLDTPSSHSLIKMRESESFCLGNDHVTFWQRPTKEIPREQKRDKLLTVSMGKSWDQSLCTSHVPKDHMFFTSQKAKDLTEGPGYLNPRCMEAVYTFRKSPLENQLLCYLTEMKHGSVLGSKGLPWSPESDVNTKQYQAAGPKFFHEHQTGAITGVLRKVPDLVSWVWISARQCQEIQKGLRFSISFLLWN